MDPRDLVKAYMVNTKTSISVLNMYIPTHTTEKLWAKWNLSPHMTEQKTPNRQCMENLNNTRKHVTDKIINRSFFSLLSTYTPTSRLQYMYFYCLISVFLSDALGYGLCITSPQYLLHPPPPSRHFFAYKNVMQFAGGSIPEIPFFLHFQNHI